MYDDEEQLRRLDEGYREIHPRHRELQELYLHRHYHNAEAKEHAIWGLLRRMSTIVRCVDNVFRLVPPTADVTPFAEAHADATIAVHAFVFNVYGALDNLAHVLVSEKSITKKNGRPLVPREIGLRKHFFSVRNALSSEMNQQLCHLDEDWFCHITKFRDDLAHGIPLRIPLSVTSATDDLGHSPTGEIRWVALMARSMRAEQRSLSVHGVLIQDFHVLGALARNIFVELER